MFVKNAIIISLKLFVITAVAALCLAAVNMVTEPIIKKNSEKNQVLAQQKVLSAAKEFKAVEAPLPDVSGVKTEKVNVGYDGRDVVGYAITVVSDAGYGGKIKVIVGVKNDLTVEKIEILEHSETAGLGANAAKPKFSGQFEGKKGGFSVVKGSAKNVNDISAISSATITSKAVTSCVNAALVNAKELHSTGGAE
ncbi:MAG: FMN-binding protein [Clostridia bacterium]|nr:FMN-binding protein [Clostridia bacterium]